MIRFLLNQHVIEINPQRPDLTVLDFLREQQSLCGTKEGCASGDCGACTVTLVELDEQNQQLQYKSVNSCVTFMSSLHNKQLLTVEHLAEQKSLHPVQQAMVDKHGSQCGFCTPGFVMSLFTFYHQPTPCNHQSIELALSGNLCRCTGYQPIIDAALHSCSNRQNDQFDQRADQTRQALRQLKNQKQIETGPFMPTDRQQLASFLSQHPNARMFAGSTDLALETTQQLTDLHHLVDLKYLPELNTIDESEQGLVIGAAVSLSKLETKLLRHFPDLKELLWRFASLPLRNQASLGGNIANASPIGDMPPALLALNAEINLDNGTTKRSVAARDFFLDYRKTALNKGEWIASIFLPYPTNSSHLRAYKVSKRFEDDISAVCAVFNLTLSETGKIAELSTGFGGIAATPIAAQGLQHALRGKDWQAMETMQLGKRILIEEFTPIDDVRASAQYRKDMVGSLWHRFWIQTSQQPIATRVINYA